MKKPVETKQARSAARLALQNLDTLGFAPTPELFTVFYHYALSEPPALKTELGRAFGDPKRLTESYLYTLYEEYFTTGKDALDLVDAVGAIVANLSATVARQGDSASARMVAMKEIKTNLGTTPGPDQLRDALLRLNQQFAEAIRENEALKSDLESANGQIADLNEQVETVTRTSMTDPLTGIGNRAAFDRKIREAISLFDRSKVSSSLVLLDIDHFKSVNDTYGHAIGDEVLKVVGSILGDVVRGSDFAARYGGEEFAAVLLGSHPIDGRRLAERLRENLATADLGTRVTEAGLKQVTASFGVAILAEGLTPMTWVELADKALYRAKANGRNRVVSETELTETKSLEDIVVLVVEDDKTSLMLLEGMLRKIGVKDVVTASDGSEGLEVLAARAVDCIVCDGVMPGIDGLELTIRVRTGEAQAAPNVPIMLLTARQEEAWATAARDAGANEFLNKPVSIERLAGAIRGMLFEPRKFIKSRSYVGPDRRLFQDPNYKGPERRGQPG